MNDAEFRRSLGSYEDFLRSIPENNPLKRLIGMKQFPTHRDIDPLEHTYNVMMLLVTDDLPSKIEGLAHSRQDLIRITIKYHDIGKLKGAFDIRHALHSPSIIEEILKEPNLYGEDEYTEDEITLIKKLAQIHDLLGRFAQGFITIDQALNELIPPFELNLSPEEMLQMHYTIIRADIESIPGLRDKLDEIDASYEELMHELKERIE
jgi:hypothetical protein